MKATYKNRVVTEIEVVSNYDGHIALRGKEFLNSSRNISIIMTREQAQELSEILLLAVQS